MSVKTEYKVGDIVHCQGIKGVAVYPRKQFVSPHITQNVHSYQKSPNPLVLGITKEPSLSESHVVYQ